MICRPHGHRRLGGDRRRRDQAVRLHAVLPRARASAGTASRSTRSTSTWKAREYGLHTRFIELAGEINTAMPRLRDRQASADALNERGKAVAGQPRPGARRRLQEGRRRHARIARRSSSWSCCAARAPRSTTPIRTCRCSRRCASTASTFAGRVRLGVDVGDLLQLERTFEGNGVVQAAAEEERVLRAWRSARPTACDLRHPGCRASWMRPGRSAVARSASASLPGVESASGLRRA